MSRQLLAGLDPFDALRGCRVPRWAEKHPRARQLVIQLRKRSPVDIARVLGVAPFVMAKAAGSMLSAIVREDRLEDAHEVSGVLYAANGNLGDGAWGYEFDVQTRWAFYPAGSPNLIATVFVARGLGTAGIAMGDSRLREELAASARFLTDSLYSGGEEPYFSYTLTSDRLVHNANLLGAGLVAMEAALRGDSDALETAKTAAMTTVQAQRTDGSWAYGEGSSLGWSDNFHTAYNLDGLLQVWLATGDTEIRDSLDRGVVHWVSGFFGLNGEPKYYPRKPYPYDIHSAGTAVDVAARLATWGWETGDLAERVAAWTAANLVNPVTGDTYYQKHRLWTDKRHFVRWGDAHWALGTSALRLLTEGGRDPLEAAVARASGVVPDAR